MTSRYTSYLVACALALGALACSDSANAPTAPAPPALDLEFETMLLQSVGIAEDQANGASLVPLSVVAYPIISTGGFESSCTFSVAAGRVVCPDVNLFGITISRSYAFYDAAGTAQAQRGSNTAAVNSQVWARGTHEHALGKVTIDRKSNLTATGVQPTSTRRTLNGTEHGTSTMEHATPRGKIVSQVVFGDTTIGLVLPQNDPAQKWPTAGTVIHAHTATRSPVGPGENGVINYRAVQVFDGTSKMTVTITVNGHTRVCVRDLALRTQSCTP